MKKIIFISIFILFIGNTFSYEYKLSPSDILIINKISNKINNILITQNLEFRKQLESTLNTIQDKYKDKPKLFKIIQEIKINTNLYNFETEYINHYKINNVNFNEIQLKWIKWHNTARRNEGVQLYTYDQRLDNTAYEWSKIQNIHKKIMSHKRNPGDSYYDYKKIEKWFNNRGVLCKVKGGATSSESIGKFGYYCDIKKEDCTFKLAESLKIIYNIYLNEKGLGYPADAHYRGIINPNLTKIGLGISIHKTIEENYYEYYVTTHYCTEFKK